MKTQFFNLKQGLLALLGLVLVSNIATAQNYNDERLGLPGDNFNLYAVMDFFQNSKTLEEFESKINQQDSKVNNLDLDNDGQTDYVRVSDSKYGTAHTIVLQVDLNQTESQDVAVFYVDKKGSNVNIQLIGDEDLYGKDYIVEPNYKGNSTPNPGYSGNQNNYDNDYYDNNNNGGYAPQIITWGIVTYIYDYGYNPWRSPWYWGYYPSYWRPWSCYYWYDYNYYWGYSYRWNRGWYNRSRHCMFNHVRPQYYQHRSRSPIYSQNKQRGVYNKVYDGREKNIRSGVKRTEGRELNQSNSIATSRQQDKQNPINGNRPGRLNMNDKNQQNVAPTRTDRPSIDRSQPSNEPVRQLPATKPARDQQNDRPSMDREQPTQAPKREQPASTPVREQRQEPAAVPIRDSRTERPVMEKTQTPRREQRSQPSNVPAREQRTERTSMERTPSAPIRETREQPTRQYSSPSKATNSPSQQRGTIKR